MASELVDIADAVVADLNANLSDWGFSGVTATRKYAPSFDLKSTAVAVTVTPRRTERSFSSTQSNEYVHSIDVEVRQVLPIGGEDAACDALEDLTDRIADRCLGLSFSDPAGMCSGVIQESVLDEDDVNQKSLFRSVVTLTVQTWRGAR